MVPNSVQMQFGSVRANSLRQGLDQRCNIGSGRGIVLRRPLDQEGFNLWGGYGGTSRNPLLVEARHRMVHHREAIARHPGQFGYGPGGGDKWAGYYDRRGAAQSLEVDSVEQTARAT